jgi:Zn-dependent M28 family amino/carboxypeptidase
MKKILILIFLIPFTGSCTLSAQYKSVAELAEILSSDEFEGRRPGTEGMRKAASFVEGYFRDIGVAPFFNGSYLDTLDVHGAESYNVVGILNQESLSDEYILIGAHLDHIGKSYPDTLLIYNGANDNASGVTAVLKVAEELLKHEFNKKVLVAAFTGEESGLVGSRHLAKRLKSAGITLSYMINFEMIGVPLTAGPGIVYKTGYGKSDFAEVSNTLLDEEFIIFEEIETAMNLFRRSDNYPFYVEFNIPSHTVSTFDFRNFPYMHNVLDEFSQLDIPHMETIIEKMNSLILALLQSEAKITLLEEVEQVL